jgi:hypothetical protein
MSPPTFEFKEESIAEIFRPPYWDPVPPWLKFNENILRRFAALEIEFKIKELEIQQEKLKQFSEMVGKM